MPHPCRLALCALLLLSAEALTLADIPALPPRKSAYCSLRVWRDYQTLGITYKAILQLDPTCSPGSVARIRKVSTLNATGPYRPQKPDGSDQFGGLWGWTVTASGSNVPDRQLWTLFSWRWQYWDGAQWITVGRS